MYSLQIFFAYDFFSYNLVLYVFWDELIEKPYTKCKKCIKNIKMVHGHCLWVTSIPHIGMEDEATAQLAW